MRNDNHGKPPRRSACRSRVRRWLAPASLLALVLASAPGGASASGLRAGDLLPGMRVEVRGRRSDGKIRAATVTIQEDSGSSLEVKGPLEGLDGPAGRDAVAAFRSGRLRILGLPIRPGANLELKGADDLESLLAAARGGHWVKLEAKDRSGVLVVSKIVLRKQTGGKPEVEGPIGKVRPRGPARARIEIGSYRIVVTGDTRIDVDDDIADRYPDAWGGSVDDDDARPRGLRVLSDRIRIGGQFGGSVDPESDLDLDRARDRDETAGRIGGQVEAAVSFHRALRGFAKVALTRIVGIREPSGTDLDDSTFRVREAYLHWAPHVRGIGSTLALQVGRQDFDEPREWLFDENLDAIRVGLRTRRRLEVQAALAGRLRDDNARAEDRTWGILLATVRVLEDVELEGYGIGRNDPTPSDDDARWLGFRSHGSFRDGLEHWLEAGWVRGQVQGRSRRGSAVDAGAVFEPLEFFGNKRAFRGLRPAVTVAFARGSGDDKSTPDVDERYRQTGLQDNNDKFSGVTSFRYYGEVLDPELTNLEILTVGIGFRALRHTSVDLVLHEYRQAIPADRVRGADIDRRPAGADPDLGTGFDLVVGFEEIRNLEVELTYGFFDPGPAFGGASVRATRSSLQFRLNF